MSVKNHIFRGLLRASSGQAFCTPITLRQDFHSATSTMTADLNMTVSGCVSEEDLYTYRAQRWMWNEPQQLNRRHVKFSLKGLVNIVERAAGEKAICTNITKLPEGNFNKAFLASMEDGRQLIVKIPNPNSGRQHYTTASEAATMGYLKTNLDIPVPRVLGYCSHANKTELGAEYIIMEKAPGVELSHVWDTLQPRVKVTLVKQLADITAKLSNARFPYYGSLYYQKDISETEGRQIDNTFAIGPITARSWFDDRREEVDVFRGPWTSAGEVMNAFVQREMACINTFPTFLKDCQQGIFNGPGGYIPTHQSKARVLRDFEKILEHILPKRDSLNTGIIWHNDLHSENIFVDTTTDSPRITSIIDWQGTPIYPMFLAAHHPSLVDFDGPKLEGYTQPVLPANIKEMSPKTKQAAKDLFLSQSLWLLYETQVHKSSADLLHAFRYADTHQSQLLGAIGSIFDDGEPYIQSLITSITAEDVWGKIVGIDSRGNPRMTCPVNYSEDELGMQRDQFAMWEKDIDRRQRVISEIGAYTGWNGAVSPDEYDEMARRLEVAKTRFLDREAGTAEERGSWERVWPFQDDV